MSSTAQTTATIRRARGRRILVAGAFLTSIALAVTGCASSSVGASGTTSTLSSSVEKQVNAIVANASKPGTWHGPSSSPKPATGKRIFALSVTQAASNGVIWTNALTAADKAIGWTTTVYDGQGQVDRYASGMEQAITQKYDAIILYGITPTLIATEVAKARKAGIPVLAISNTTTPSPTSINYNIGFNEQNDAKIAAAEVTKLSGGKADIGVLYGSQFGITVERNNYFKQYLKEFCPGCKIVNSLNITAADIGTPALEARIAGTLQANPNINFLVPTFDDVGVSEVQALQQLNLTNKVKIVSYQGSAQGLQYVGQGLIEADIALPNAWMSWEAVDSLNRIFHGDTNLPKRVTNSEPNRLITKATPPPPAGQQWSGDYNYAAKYKTLWGVG